jgi:hypothetical protein
VYYYDVGLIPNALSVRKYGWTLLQSWKYTRCNREPYCFLKGKICSCCRMCNSILTCAVHNFIILAQGRRNNVGNLMLPSSACWFVACLIFDPDNGDDTFLWNVGSDNGLHYIPEDGNICNYCCENLKSYIGNLSLCKKGVVHIT